MKKTSHPCDLKQYELSQIMANNIRELMDIFHVSYESLEYNAKMDHHEVRLIEREIKGRHFGDPQLLVELLIPPAKLFDTLIQEQIHYDELFFRTSSERIRLRLAAIHLTERGIKHVCRLSESNNAIIKRFKMFNF